MNQRDEYILSSINNDIDMLFSLSHYGVKGQRPGYHDPSRRWQKQANYADGRDDPNAPSRPRITGARRVHRFVVGPDGQRRLRTVILRSPSSGSRGSNSPFTSTIQRVPTTSPHQQFTSDPRKVRRHPDEDQFTSDPRKVRRKPEEDQFTSDPRKVRRHPDEDQFTSDPRKVRRKPEDQFTSDPREADEWDDQVEDIQDEDNVAEENKPKRRNKIPKKDHVAEAYKPEGNKNKKLSEADRNELLRNWAIEIGGLSRKYQVGTSAYEKQAKKINKRYKKYKELSSYLNF